MSVLSWCRILHHFVCLCKNGMLLTVLQSSLQSLPFLSPLCHHPCHLYRHIDLHISYVNHVGPSIVSTCNLNLAAVSGMFGELFNACMCSDHWFHEEKFAIKYVFLLGPLEEQEVHVTEEVLSEKEKLVTAGLCSFLYPVLNYLIQFYETLE